MNILRRHIGRTLLFSILMVLLVFIGLQVFIGFIGQVSDLGRGYFTANEAFIYVLLMTPSQLYQLFPMVGLLGALIGLGILANQNELIVMRASGVSKRWITFAVMRIALVVMLTMILVGELAGPYLQHIAENRKTLLENNGQALVTAQGIWTKQGNDFVHIDEAFSSAYLKGILIYTFNPQHQLTRAVAAKEARFQQGQWLLLQVTASLFQNNHVKRVAYAQLPWSLSFTANIMRFAETRPDELTLPVLWQTIEFRDRNGLASADYALVFWHRVFQPLATLIMIFLAVPCVFGSLRSLTMGVRVFMGVLLGLVFFFLNELISRFSLVIHLPALMAILIPLFLFFFLGVFWMRRSR